MAKFKIGSLVVSLLLSVMLISGNAFAQVKEVSRDGVRYYCSSNPKKGYQPGVYNKKNKFQLYSDLIKKSDKQLKSSKSKVKKSKLKKEIKNLKKLQKSANSVCKSFCGDNKIQAPEQCEDGNFANNDGCSDSCRIEFCGDGIVQAGEQCDNPADPSCSNKCRIIRNVTQVATGFGYTCVLLDTGKVRCWGDNSLGQLGHGDTKQTGHMEDRLPAYSDDVDVGGTVIQVTTGQNHTCALLDTGKVRCWGSNGNRELGYGHTENIGDNEAPASAGNVNIAGKVNQIVAGTYHTCALLDTGKVRCWGSIYAENDNDLDFGAAVTQIAIGTLHTCILLDTGKVRCWGGNLDGQLGYGNTQNYTYDSAGDIDVGGTVTQIAAGYDHTCALLDTGRVRCWGGNGSGQLGYGNTDDIGDNETPASAGDVNVGGMVMQIAAGVQNTCALLYTGNVRCWGNNGSGNLGYGNIDNIGDNEAPASAGDVNVGGKIAQIATSANHACATLDTGRVRCWGGSFSGQLGYGNLDQIGDNETPANAGDVPV